MRQSPPWSQEAVETETTSGQGTEVRASAPGGALSVTEKSLSLHHPINVDDHPTVLAKRTVSLPRPVDQRQSSTWVRAAGPSTRAFRSAARPRAWRRIQ